MAPKRLSETEKQEIAERYRQPQESTATLSRAFGVSTSTIGRLLKSSFTPEEYDELVRQKRSIGRGSAARSSVVESTSSISQASEASHSEAVSVAPESEPSEPLDLLEPQASGHAESIRAVISVEEASGNRAQTTDNPDPKRRSRTRSRTRSRAVQNAEAQLGLGLDEDKSDSSPVLPDHSELSENVTSEPASEMTAGRSPRRRRRRSSVSSSTETSETARRTEHRSQENVNPGDVNDVGVGMINTTELPHEADRPESTTSETPTLDSANRSPRTRQRRTRRIVRTSPLNESPSGISGQREAQEPVQEMLASDDSLEEAPSQIEAWSDSLGTVAHHATPSSVLNSPPLSEAVLPKTCYLVVDRLSELISRPLQDFEELGEIPPGETQEQTLPIFDNHRVARRFANRSQRVMKIPDSRVLQKTGAHLQAKGITRVLIDGKVYSLS